MKKKSFFGLEKKVQKRFFWLGKKKMTKKVFFGSKKKGRKKSFFLLGKYSTVVFTAEYSSN